MPKDSFGWLDVRVVGERLAQAHPGVDPMTIRFVDLRRMVEALPGFHAEPGHPVNERILETIQMCWRDEAEDAPRDDD